VVYDGKSGSGRFLVEEEGAGGSPITPPITATWWSRSTAGLSTWLSSATGTRVLTREDLEPVCSELKGVLVGKNVSEEVAEVITRSVGSQLEGRTLEGGVTLNPTARLQTAVAEALRDAIERILSPTDPVDLLHDVRCHVEVQAGMPVGRRDPYVAVFCGVNGVGKSTTLAKVAFHLRDNGCRVMIAACDSFRAGAVEQLKKHCTNLDVELYAQGYQKDPVEIARAAIRKAREGGQT
jgi:signal recognition particle receptor subunit alpha